MSSSPVDKPLPLANTFDELSGPPVDVSVSDDICPGCGGALEHEGVDVAYVTDIPAKPKTQVTEYRVQVCRCRGCGRRIRGRHADLPSRSLRGDWYSWRT